jgi:hypothetical protein
VFVRCDRGALYAHTVLFDRLGCFHRHLVVGAVTVFDAQIVVLEVNVEERQNQLDSNARQISHSESQYWGWTQNLVLDPLPDYPGHLISIKLHDWILHVDLLVKGPCWADTKEIKP